MGEIIRRPNEYSIGIDKFSVPPTSFDKSFSSNDIITRENFTAFFIKCNAVSQSILERQRVYLDWFRVNNGFNWNHTFLNFMAEGGWYCLSQDEQFYFMEKLKEVRRHSRIQLNLSTPIRDMKIDPAGTYNHVISGVMSRNSNLFVSKFGEFAGMSEANLMRNLAVLYKR